MAAQPNQNLGRDHNNLESIIDKDDEEVGLKESFKRFSLWDWTKVGGLALASGYYVAQIMSPFAAVINVGSQLVSYVVAHAYAMKDKVTKNNLQGEIQLGNIMTPIFTSFFKGISYIPQWWAKIGTGIAALPLLTAIYTFISHPVRNYKVSEAITNLDEIAEESIEATRKNFKSVAWRSLAAGLIPYSLNVNLIPVNYQLPASSILRPFQRTFIRAGEKIDYKSNESNKPLHDNVAQFPGKAGKDNGSLENTVQEQYQKAA